MRQLMIERVFWDVGMFFIRNLSYFCLVCKLCSSPPKVTPTFSIYYQIRLTKKKRRKEKNSSGATFLLLD